MARQSEKVSLVFPGRTCSTRNSHVSASVRATASDKSMFCILTTMLLIELPPYTLRIAEMKVLHINQMAIFSHPKTKKSRPQAALLPCYSVFSVQDYQSDFPRPHGQLGTISETGLFQHVEDVRLNGCHGHVQSLGNLLIGVAAGHLAQHEPQCDE